MRTMASTPGRPRLFGLLATAVVVCFLPMAGGLLPADVVGDEGVPPGRDLRIDRIEPRPDDAALGEATTFQLKITNQIEDSLAIPLTVWEGDQAASDDRDFARVGERKLVLRRGQQTVAVSVTPRTEGVRTYRFELPRQPDEVDFQNNRRSVRILVVKLDLKVLLIAGQPTREYLFLAPALLGDPTVNLTCYLQSADVDYVQQGNTCIETLPGTVRDWAAFDVIILLDADPKSLTNNQIDILKKAVAKGAGLVVVAGRYNGLAEMMKTHGKDVGDLLPVEFDAKDQPKLDNVLDRPFRIARTEVGKAHLLFDAGDGPKANEEVGSKLEGIDLHWSLPTQAKPQATVLANCVMGKESWPAVVVGQYGQGTVMFCAADALWRWRSAFDGFDYERFWVRAMRCAAEAKLKALGCSPVTGRRPGLGDAAAEDLRSPDSAPDREDSAFDAPARPGQGATYPGKDPAFLVLPHTARRTAAAERLLTPEVRQMAEKALHYLATTQNEDGSWSDSQFPSNTGVTGLCCLALMAEGSQPRVGKYGRALDRGLEFLLKNAQTNGVIATKGSNPFGPAYEHAYAMLALIHAQGDMPWQPEARDVISKGVQAIARAQKPADGGWRYDFGREGQSDLSVTANALWVQRTAKQAGFTVSAETVAKGVAFVEKCATPDGTFRYRTFGIVASPSLGGMGVLALCDNGGLRHPLIRPVINRIDHDYKRYTVEDFKDRRYFVYGCLYANLAMHMCGDAYWVPCFRKSSQVLSAVQGKDGQFPDEHGNKVYTTAMAAIILHAPLGYLPLFQR